MVFGRYSVTKEDCSCRNRYVRQFRQRGEALEDMPEADDEVRAYTREAAEAAERLKVVVAPDVDEAAHGREAAGPVQYNHTSGSVRVSAGTITGKSCTRATLHE